MKTTMIDLFSREPNYRRAIMLLAHQLTPDYGRSMAMTFAWQAYRAYQAYKAEIESDRETHRQAFRARRLKEIREERWLERVRQAPLMRDHGTWDAIERTDYRPGVEKVAVMEDRSELSPWSKAGAPTRLRRRVA